MFELLIGALPYIPGLIKAGIVSYESFIKIKKLYDEDKSMTPDERAQLETMIAEVEARIDDTSKDVPV